MADIKILDGGSLSAILDNFSSFEETRAFFDAGSFRLQISASVEAASEIIKGRLLLPPDGPNAYLIEQIERSLSVTDSGVIEDIITATGRDFGGFFAERICLPTAGSAYDTVTSVTAEYAMKHFVTANAGSGAAASRQIPNFVVAADAGNGPLVTTQVRYDNLLQVLSDIGHIGGIGWQTTYNSVTGQHTFDVLVGADK